MLIEFDKLYKKMNFELQKKLKVTLDRLNAVKDFNEFLTLGLGRPHLLHNNLEGYYGVELNGNIRLVIKPEDDNLDSNIYIIKGVVDYHGDKQEWIIP